ncbi:MAG TPA: hypothetical protein VFG68_05940, partial [Fimbriiglobus sp.]|nr:hypothetical protein [Fimbriiglobus sp.]
IVARPADTPPPALTGPARSNGSADAAPDKAHLQTWVSQQLDTMNHQRSTEWADVVEKLKSSPTDG